MKRKQNSATREYREGKAKETDSPSTFEGPVGGGGIGEKRREAKNPEVKREIANSQSPSFLILPDEIEGRGRTRSPRRNAGAGKNKTKYVGQRSNRVAFSGKARGREKKRKGGRGVMNGAKLGRHKERWMAREPEGENSSAGGGKQSTSNPEKRRPGGGETI